MTDRRILLFDLGGVLIELRIAESVQAMTGGKLSWPEIKTLLIGNPVVRAFECGQCSPESFADNFIRELDLTVSTEEFLAELATWPVGFYEGALPLLERLREAYTLACISNTNEVHWQASWEDRFDYPIASHKIGLAKPDPASYEAALDILGAPAETVWFFDDTLPNVEAARKLGFNAYHTDGFAALTSALEETGFLSGGKASR